MKKRIKKNNIAYRFKRYCRKAYAAFNSLHREVTIGRVATYIADKQLRKAVAAAAVALTLLPTNHAMAQTDDAEEMITLPEVRVSVSTDTVVNTPQPAVVLSAKDFSNTSVRCIGDLLELLPGIDIRSRGTNDVQGDIAVHGGTFDQMIVLLNGINITDAQTGHHNLDMPIDISMVERVELLTPSTLLARGIVSYCGAVNIVVSDSYCDRLLAEASAGSYGTGKLSVLGTKLIGSWATTVAASYNRSDGYMRNTDYRYGSLFMQAIHQAPNSNWHLQIGGQMKDFGSMAFYSTTYPDQYEATRTLTASATNLRRLGKVRLANDIYSRLHSDRFELFREGYADAPEWYGGHNRHLAATSGLRSRALLSVGRHGELITGIELRHEGIASNVLGTPLDTALSLFGTQYPKAASRLATSLFAGYNFSLGGWQASASALTVYSNFFGWNYGLSANAAYRFNRHLRMQAAVSRTYRMPTFTDLYYQSVNQRANPDLNGEQAWSGEAEIRYTDKRATASALVYYRSGKDVIDWIRRPDEEIWYSMNHTQVDAAGVDIAGRYNFDKFINAVGGSYSYCGIKQDAGGMISGSVLDYLRHKAQAYVVLAPWSKLLLKIDATYRFREGQYVDASGNVCNYGGVFLLNAKAEYLLKDITLFAQINNIANSQYRDHGGVPQPGTMIFAGAKLSLGNK